MSVSTLTDSLVFPCLRRRPPANLRPSDATSCGIPNPAFSPLSPHSLIFLLCHTCPQEHHRDSPLTWSVSCHIYKAMLTVPQAVTGAHYMKAKCVHPHDSNRSEDDRTAHLTSPWTAVALRVFLHAHSTAEHHS